MKPAIVFQTDFSLDTSAVCTMHGVCRTVDPSLDLYNNTHTIPAFDTFQASIALDYIVPFWPEGTVFVSVVDPGVGTSRRASVAKLRNGSYVVTPDNGSLTHMKNGFGIEAVREIDEDLHRLAATRSVSIFHGRDLFAHCAAKLAAGNISFEEVGPAYAVEDIIVHPIPAPTLADGVLSGMIDYASTTFGLVRSNIPAELLKQCGIQNGDILSVVIRNGETEVYRADVPLHPSFGYVEQGEPVVMISETMTLQIANNQTNFVKQHQVGGGPGWSISFAKR